MEENQIVIYQTEDGQTQIDVRLENDTVWLTANQMAALFDRDEKTIRKHVNNVFNEGELEKNNNTHFLRVDGVKQPVAVYNLDVIISVGYRVKSKRGIAFRIWARQIIKDYLVRGYAINQRIQSDTDEVICHSPVPVALLVSLQMSKTTSCKRVFYHNSCDLLTN